MLTNNLRIKHILFFLKIMFVIIFITLSISTTISKLESNNVVDYFLLSIFIFILLLDIYLTPKKSYLNLLIYLTIALNIIGVFIIEHDPHPFYLYEVEQWTGYAGSIPYLLLVQFFFVQGINFALNERKLPYYFDTRVIFKYSFLFLLSILLTFTYLQIFIHKPAPILGVDRFVYDKLILGPYGRITNLLFYFSLGLGILFFKEKKKLYLLLLALIELAFFLKGHKFWNFVQILFLFTIPYVAYINNKKILRTLVGFSVFVIVAIFIAVKINLYYFPSFQPYEYVKQRAAQEGQLWWSTYKNYPERLRFDEALDEFNKYFHLNYNNQYEIGMYKMMYLNTTPKRFEWKISKLSRYVYSTPALLYYYFGIIGALILLMLFGIIWGLWLRFVIFTIIQGNLLQSILLSRLFYIFRKAFKDGDIYKLFSVEFLVIIIFIAIIYIITEIMTTNNKLSYKE